MEVLQTILQLLILSGCWRPPSWTSPFKKFLYAIYTMFLFLLLYSATFLEFLDLILNVENQDELSDNIHVLLTMFAACCKMYSMLTHHKNIAVLTNILNKKPFQPENEEEIQIRKACDKTAQQQAILYVIMVELTVIFNSGGGLLKDGKKLPFRMWLPCNYLPPVLHVFIFLQQVASFVATSIMHISCDCLIWGLLIHSCGQLEILGSRLKAIKQGDNQSAKKSARYHNHVYEFTRMINEEFKMVIFVQFGISTLAVCFDLYVLITLKNTNMKIMMDVIYMVALLVQIFFYCWHGNELKLKSVEVSEMIFGSDWTELNKDTKRILSVIMRRATMCIEFTSGHIVTMNLESFINLIKTSYSAYNVLHRGKG